MHTCCTCTSATHLDSALWKLCCSQTCGLAELANPEGISHLQVRLLNLEQVQHQSDTHTHRTMCSFSTSAIPSLQVSAAHVFFHILSLICTKTVSGGLALFPQPRLCQNAWPSRGTTKSGLKRSTDRPPVVPPPVRYDWTRPGPPGPGRPTEPKRSYDWSLSSSHSAGRRSQNTIPRSHSLPKQLARVVPSSHLPQGHPFHGELLVGG